ncbi:MAG: hypothetical protein V3S82_10615 [Dehalococcoidia bacterium]
MPEIVAKLRWYPGDELVPIEDADIESLTESSGARISVDRVDGKKLVMEGGKLLEEPRGVSLDETVQTIITVTSETEAAFRKAIRGLVDRYRAPVPVWGLWGSNEQGEDIASEEIENDDGWW